MKPIWVVIAAAVLIAGVYFWQNQAAQNQNEMEEEPQAMSEADTSVAGMADEGEESELENTIYMNLSSGGRVVIRTFPDKAPNHVARFKELAREGFYDGVVFHRVIEGFMAQTGDPTGTGSGGSGQNIKAEFNDVPHTRGIVSTARAGHPDSADSQFFIMLADAPHLDGQYTVWGEVIEGMEHVDNITKGPREANGEVPVDQRDHIVSMTIAADADDASGGSQD